jgi:hypothetical protein
MAASATSSTTGSRPRRAIAIWLEDFDVDDGFVYDVALHGPLVGFSFRF